MRVSPQVGRPPRPVGRRPAFPPVPRRPRPARRESPLPVSRASLPRHATPHLQHGIAIHVSYRSSRLCSLSLSCVAVSSRPDAEACPGMPQPWPGADRPQPFPESAPTHASALASHPSGCSLPQKCLFVERDPVGSR